MLSFSGDIKIIGVNPYMLLPEEVLESLFEQSNKRKGAIPVRGTINGHIFIQTLIRYSGQWRLYVNTQMRKNAGVEVGDRADIELEYDPGDRTEPMHPDLSRALGNNITAREIYEKLSPSHKKEINRYINNIKSDGIREKNIGRSIDYLMGKVRFVGRDYPSKENPANRQ